MKFLMFTLVSGYFHKNNLNLFPVRRGSHGSNCENYFANGASCSLVESFQSFHKNMRHPMVSPAHKAAIFTFTAVTKLSNTKALCYEPEGTGFDSR
jgi:hypothetical protein